MLLTCTHYFNFKLKRRCAHVPILYRYKSINKEFISIYHIIWPFTKFWNLNSTISIKDSFVFCYRYEDKYLFDLLRICMKSYKFKSKILERIFEAHIIHTVNTTLDKDNMMNYVKYIEIIYQYYIKYTKLIKYLFLNDKNYVYCLDRAYRKILNTYMTTNMLKYKNISVALVQYISSPKFFLLNVKILLKIISYLENKHIFQEYFMKYITNNIASPTTQYKLTIFDTYAHLFDRCFSLRIKKVIQDINHSKSIFCTFIRENNLKLNCDKINILLSPRLEKYIWIDENIVLNEKFQSIKQTYEIFYNNLYKNRKLFWVHSLSQCYLIMNTCCKKTWLEVNIYQMNILLMFNNCNIKTIDKIRKEMNISNELLISNLNPILKLGILRMKNDSIIFNNHYKSCQSYIKLRPILPRRRKFINDNAYNFVSIKLFIVRVMKMNKYMKCGDLISKTAHKFKLMDQKVINKCIDELICDEYIRKDESMNHYLYIP